MKIILMGPPGSGKGTQSGFIAAQAGVESISSGDLFRDNLSRHTDLGITARSYMEKGEYVPDDVTINMIMDWISKPENSKGFVLDGFPRTLKQAEALEGFIGLLDLALYFNVTNENLLQRLTGRLLCKKCQASFHKTFYPSKNPGKCDFCNGDLYQREDDKAEVVYKRLDVYERETKPVVDFYNNQGKLVQIDGAKSIKEIEIFLSEVLK
jgi:adenylate kinase